MHLMFGNTYVRVYTFSTMKQVKFKNTNQMADQTLDDSFRLTLVMIKERARKASTTDITLIEICNKILFAIL